MKKQIFLAALLSCFAILLSAQQSDDIVASGIQTATLYKVVNMQDIEPDFGLIMKNIEVIHEPGTEGGKDDLRSLKQLAEASAGNGSAVQSQKTAVAGKPQIGLNWVGNGANGVPNDNSLAISNDGKIVSVVNTNIYTYAEPNPVNTSAKTLAGFASLGWTMVSDPWVKYDINEDRFIVGFIKGFSSSSNEIVVAFSQTNDPAGSWNIYKFPGNVVSGAWIDYPQFGLGSQELFVTGNPFADGSGIAQGSVFWQIDKMAGYQGAATLNYQTYTSGEFSFHPVQGGATLYGPEFYFLRTDASMPSSNTIYVRKIDNTLGNGGTMGATIALTLNQSYSVPSDADQKGTSTKLSTNDSRMQTAFFENNVLHFAFNTNVAGQPGIYYGTIKGIAVPIFASATGQLIKIDSFDIAFPGLAYGGKFDGNQNSSLLFFNFASPNHYAGNAAVYIDETGAVSEPVICKYGNSAQTGGGSPSRWGDYMQVCGRGNNPGEAWVGGGFAAGGQNSTYISQVFAPHLSAAAPAAAKTETKVSIYPNPSAEQVSFEFDVPSTAPYQVNLYDAEGKLIENSNSKTLKKGTARVSFQVHSLPSGIYFIEVQGAENVLVREKFVVSH